MFADLVFLVNDDVSKCW